MTTSVTNQNVSLPTDKPVETTNTDALDAAKAKLAQNQAEFEQINDDVQALDQDVSDLQTFADEHPNNPQAVIAYAKEHYSSVMGQIGKLLKDVGQAKKEGNPLVNDPTFDEVLVNLEDWSKGFAAIAGHEAPSAPGSNEEPSGVPVPAPIPAPTPKPNGKGKPSTNFGWVKTYSSVALWSMTGAMIANSDAIQAYIYGGLQGLSLAVEQSSQTWSAWGIARIGAENKAIQDELAGTDDKDTKNQKINAYTTQFNTYNTDYQQFLEWFNSMNDGLNNTSSNTTQTQTQDNSNITQGPIALLQTITNTWAVVA